MSSRFTELTLAVAVLAMLGGCATRDGASQSTAPQAGGPAAAARTEPTPKSPAEAFDADADAGQRESARRGWLPDPRGLFGGAGADEPVALKESNRPKVKGRNAADFEAAVAAMKAEDWASAERLLRRITADQPELAGPWVNLGQVALQLGDVEGARRAFRQAIAANPENCAAYNQLGVLFRTQGDFESAEDLYLKCLNGSPDFAKAYLNLGILYELYLGRLEEALKAYRQYQNLVPEPDRKVAGWVMDLERRTGG
ncbi:MAG: tetratricopeptide repeat protein [Pseudomonadota bacterium]